MINCHLCKKNISELSKISFHLRKFHNGMTSRDYYDKCLISLGENECLNFIESETGNTISRQYKVQGYFLDGYIEKYNIAIEFDEENHKNFVAKDNTRQREIENYLECSFFRIKEYEWDLSKEEVILKFEIFLGNIPNPKVDKHCTIIVE